MRRILIAAAVAVALAALAASGRASTRQVSGVQHTGRAAVTVSVFATGFNNPRGLTFGPDWNLYVAEGGLGGHDSTVGICDQAHGAAAPYTGSTHSQTLGGRISKVTPTGVVTRVVTGLPSSQTSAALGSLASGVSSVAFIGDQLYALLAGAGCSHGVRTVPNGVIRVNSNGTWSMIANLSAFQHAHPVAHPDLEDFEPDGTWFSMAAADGALYPMDSNHGELDRVTPGGTITRVIDISASLGHVVPTAIVHRGSFFISNLGLFDPTDLSGDENVWQLPTGGGGLTLHATGLEKVLGLAFRGNDLYALEMSTSAGGPTPGNGALVRISGGHPVATIASGLVFPTGLAVGPDGAFYVSERGFGFGAGGGRILRITTP
jgi:hypothetical protein